MSMILDAKDMEKLATAFFDNLQLDNNEYGGIGVDCKRPFGNSDVEGDILEIIGARPEGEERSWSENQRAYAAALYRCLIPHLKRKYGSKASPTQ
jgi:hypothetical protein